MVTTVLPARNHLPDLCLPGRDHAIGVGNDLGIGKLLLGLCQGCLSLYGAGSGAFEVLLGEFRHRERRYAPVEQCALAALRPRCIGQLRFGACQIGLGAAQRGGLKLGIERRKARASGYNLAHFRATGDKPAEGAEAELRFVAGLDAARERSQDHAGLRIDRRVKHGADGRGFGWLRFAAS